MPTALGEKLASARRQRHWSLREVEARTGIHNAHLSQIETGAIERPDPSILWTLSEVYDLNFDDLMQVARHVQPGTNDRVYRTETAVAWRVLEELTPEEQRAVMEYMAELRKRRTEDRSGQS